MNAILAALHTTLVEIADSKKAMMSVAAAVAVVLTTIAGRAGWTWLDADTANALALKMTGLAAAYLVSQGAADHGKEAASVASPPASLQVVPPKP